MKNYLGKKKSENSDEAVMEENIVQHKVTLHLIFIFSFQINLGVLMHKSPQSVCSLTPHCLTPMYLVPHKHVPLYSPYSIGKISANIVSVK